MMKALYAMKKGELLEKILEHQVPHLNISVASDKDQFFSMINDVHFGIVVVNCELFADTYPWEWMLPLTKIGNAKVLIIGDSVVYDSVMLDVVMRLAADFSFRYLPAGGSNTETSNLVYEEIMGKSDKLNGRVIEYGKCVTVFSAAPKDGATTIATNLAISAALSSQDMRVALIDLNLKNPEVGHQLDLQVRSDTSLRIRPRLQTNVLHENDLLDSCVAYSRVKGLYIMTGSNRRDTYVDMTPEMVHNLIDLCRRTFDVTVIDAGAYPDNAATIVSVKEADKKLLVTQNQHQSFLHSWGEWFNCSWRQFGLSTESIDLVVNKEDKANNAGKIAKYLEMSRYYSIPLADEQNTSEGKPAYFNPGSAVFKSAIDALVESVTNVGNQGQLPSRNAWWKKLLSI
ncbi:AAA family ATPase [Paenibacillus sp. GXUN7292]|uniref:AAA family ATPase n=1 Tax=Paenibacillus sp. GXUN7292 TaxID=3422499 RepID=UPI003D7E42C8